MSQNRARKSSLTRRWFLKHSAIFVTGANIPGLFSCTLSTKTNNVIRLVAYNVLKCTGWPVENVMNKENIPGLMVKELIKYKPDIINFSESPDEPTVKQIAHLLKMNYSFFPSAGDWPGVIITQYKISQSANVPISTGKRSDDLFTRHWGKVTLELPGDRLVVVHSVHLFPHDNPASAEIRTHEISHIIKSIQQEFTTDRPVILMGDLNHTPEMTEYMHWINAGFIDTFAVAGSGSGLTIRADNPSKRIDYILTYGMQSESILRSRALYEGAFRTNHEDPSSYALSDHLPQYAEIKTN